MHWELKHNNMEKLHMQTHNIVDENIKKIAELFPNCLTERLDENGKPEVAIDFDQLRQEFSKDIVEGPEERYQFTWPDKRNAIRLANAPTTDTLRPCREESVDFDNTQNLYIEGDNLEVLKLLRENYLGKVKMIYIDPPYNTGNDFVYNDDFAQTAGDYVHNSGQEDKEGNRLVANTESNGRFHTDWLNMIYPRLKVAKDLLCMDGVLFISIDDGELDNLRKVCNEVFGEVNFVADIAVVNNLKGRNDKKYIARANERMLMYVRSLEFEEYGLSLDAKVVKDYKEKDINGDFRLLELRKRGGADTREERPNMYYPFYVNPQDGTVRLEKDETHYVEALPIKSDGIDGRWRWGKDTALKNIEYVVGKQVQGKERYNIYEKDYLEDENGQRRIRPKSVMSGASYSTDGATKEYRALMKPIEFDSPKPVQLLRDLVEYSISPEEEAIVLDFFSGSATTAHAVMQLNAEDGGNRKFILVQLPEATDEKSEAYKAGYKNICEIGKERIRRAGNKIVEEQEKKRMEEGLFAGSSTGSEARPLDIGFRVLKLDSSNMQDVYYSPEQFNENLLFEDNIKHDRTDEDLLFQAMIELGIELSAKIEKREITGKTIWSVADNYLMACFDKDVNETTITEIARQHPYYFVLRDSSLATDNVADNFEQIWEEYSKETIRRII
jgi:adenine-specific DNA-methyltransferase